MHVANDSSANYALVIVMAYATNMKLYTIAISREIRSGIANALSCPSKRKRVFTVLSPSRSNATLGITGITMIQLAFPLGMSET